jgi:hypothetical protein
VAIIRDDKIQVTSTVARDAVPANIPLLPTVERLAPHLRQIDAARWYSNHGPLHEQLTTRLANHFAIDPRQLALASCGTSALIGAILALAGHATLSRPLCLCPSYTFVATAAAVRACGFAPFLVDIEPATWSASPSRLEFLPQIERAGGALWTSGRSRILAGLFGADGRSGRG